MRTFSQSPQSQGPSSQCSAEEVLEGSIGKLPEGHALPPLPHPHRLGACPSGCIQGLRQGWLQEHCKGVAADLWVE